MLWPPEKPKPAMARINTNGIDLNVEISGEGPAVVLLHGFTGSSETWDPFRGIWDEFTTVAIDIIGHGRSDAPSDPARFAVDACIDDLIALLDYLEIKRCGLLGYSMGGRIALRFALHHSQMLWGLVLESASPGIDDPTIRSERVSGDEELAGRIESAGLEEFVNYWQQIPMWDSQVSLSAETRQQLRSQRLASSPRGLANSLRGMGAGHDVSVMSQLGKVSLPTVLLAGSLDTRYAELAAQMAAALPSAELNVIEGAGHAIHLEKPGRFASVVTDFLHCYAPVHAEGV